MGQDNRTHQAAEKQVLETPNNVLGTKSRGVVFLISSHCSPSEPSPTTATCKPQDTSQGTVKGCSILLSLLHDRGVPPRHLHVTTALSYAQHNQLTTQFIFLCLPSAKAPRFSVRKRAGFGLTLLKGQDLSFSPSTSSTYEELPLKKLPQPLPPACKERQAGTSAETSSSAPRAQSQGETRAEPMHCRNLSRKGFCMTYLVPRPAKAYASPHLQARLTVRAFLDGSLKEQSQLEKAGNGDRDLQVCSRKGVKISGIQQPAL